MFKLSNFLHKKHKEAKLNLTFMIALSTDSLQQQRNMAFVTRRWQNYIDAHVKQTMLHNFDTKAKVPTYYFSPCALQNFLNYIRSLVENRTIIPNTHGQQFHGVIVSIKFLENLFEMHNKRHVTQNGHWCIVSVNKEGRTFTGIHLEDYADDLTYLINYLLFCSYSKEQIDNLDSLSGEYQKISVIAHEFLNQYQSEHKQIYGKKLDRSHIAHKPSLTQFADRNHSAVYVPILTTQAEQNVANAPHHEHDTNVFNLGSRDNSGKIIREEEQDREEQDLNRRVNRKYMNKERQNRAQARKEKRISAMVQRQQKLEKNKNVKAAFKKAKEQRKKKQLAEEKKKEQQGQQNKNTKGNSLQDQIKTKMKKNTPKSNNTNQKQSKNKRVAKKQSKQHQSVTHKARTNNRHKNTQTKSVRQDTKNPKTQPKKPKKATKKAVRKNNQQHTNQSATPIFNRQRNADINNQNHKNQRAWNIDYSSSKQPYIFTKNQSTLTQSLKGYYNLQPPKQLVHFRTFKTAPYTKLPKHPKQALKNGTLNNQKYIQMKDNDFKVFANHCIKNEEQLLNTNEQQNEINVKKQALKILQYNIPKVMSKYNNNTELRSEAVQHCRQNMKKYYQQLSKAEKKRLHINHKALEQQLAIQWKQNQAQIHTYYNQMRRKVDSWLNLNITYIYNHSKNRRTNRIIQQLRQQKNTMLRTLKLDLHQHRLNVIKHTSKVGHLLFNAFNQQLQKKHQQYIKTATNLAQLQIKQNTSQHNLQQLRLKAQHASENGKHNQHLEQEISKMQAYTSNIEKRYDNAQNQINQLREKALERLDKNNHMQSTLDSLQTNQNNNNQLQQKLNSAQKENQKLSQQLTNSSALGTNSELAKQMTESNRQTAQLQNSLASVSHQATNYQKQVSAAQARISSMDTQNQSLQQHLQTLNTSQPQSNYSNATNQSTINNLNNQLAQARNTINSYKNQSQKQSNSQANSNPNTTATASLSLSLSASASASAEIVIQQMLVNNQPSQQEVNHPHLPNVNNGLPNNNQNK